MDSEQRSWWCDLDRDNFSRRQPLEESRMRNTLLEPGVKKALLGIEWLDEQERMGKATRRNRVVPRPESIDG